MAVWIADLAVSTVWRKSSGESRLAVVAMGVELLYRQVSHFRLEGLYR